MDSLSRICYSKIPEYEFSSRLNTGFTGKHAIFLCEINSTNVFARENIKNLKDGTIIVADYQTLGRGRMNRLWFSPKGQGLWATIILKNPHMETEKLPLINLLISLAITESIFKVSGKHVYIKWPNDLIYEGKKICGILSEFLSSEKVLICGFGINTGKNISFPGDILAEAGSIELEGDREREFLLKEILERFEYFYRVSTGEKILKEWRKHSISLNRTIEIGRGEKNPARVIDIGTCGELIVEINGKRKAIYSGDDISVIGDR